MGKRFFIKRLFSKSKECSTLDIRSSDLLVCVGDTDSFTLEESDLDNFPPLIEVEHVPMLDTGIALNYQAHELMPPSAHMLYVCLQCAEADLSSYTLYLAPQVLRDDDNVDPKPKKDSESVKAEFLEYHSDDIKFLDNKFEVVELEPFELKFNTKQKTPETTTPSSEPSVDNGLYYIRLLFLIGDVASGKDLDFKDTQIVDIADDSPSGFPAYLKLWVSKSKDSVNKASLRADTETNLLFVDTMPENGVQESSGRDELEELGKMDDEEYEKIEN